MALVALLPVFEDEGVVGHTIRSLAGRVDRCVVFDGAWRSADGKVFAGGKGPSRDGTLLECDRTAREVGLELEIVERKRPWRSQPEKRTAMFRKCGGRPLDQLLLIDSDERLTGRFPEYYGDGMVLLRNVGGNDLPGIRRAFPHGDYSTEWRPALRVFAWSPDLGCVVPGWYTRTGQRVVGFSGSTPVLPLIDGPRIEHRPKTRGSDRIAAKRAYYLADHPARKLLVEEQMGLVSSGSLQQGGIELSDKIAEKDILGQDGAGRTVVAVPKGQPIPEDLEALRVRSGLVSIDAPQKAQQKAQKPVEDKAKRAPAKKTRK